MSDPVHVDVADADGEEQEDVDGHQDRGDGQWDETNLRLWLSWFVKMIGNGEFHLFWIYYLGLTSFLKLRIIQGSFSEQKFNAFNNT